MGYSSNVIARAKRQLESDNAYKKSEHEKKLSEAYSQLPRLKEIDTLMRRSMVLAAQAAFTKGTEAQSVMQQARQANQALQAERKALINAHFPPDWLDDEICERCGGSGYLGSTMCSCLEALCRAEQKKEVSVLSCGASRFEDFKLEYYPSRKIPGTDINIRSVMAKTLEICKQYAAFFPNTQQNLLLSGDTGLGKTFLSACIATALTDRGFSVAYESAPTLFNALEKAKFTSDPEQRSRAEEACNKYTSCDLLIIDDLGTELGSQFVTAALYNLINERYLNGKATIISTNLTNEELESRYSPQILSRLRGNYRRVTFVGDDIRVLKNRGIL